MSQCWYCQNTLELNTDFGRGDICSKCRRDTRVCKNCEFYDPTQHNECREPQADRVLEKERSNFCDYFKPGVFSNKLGQKNPTTQDLKTMAESLFKKKKPEI